MERKSFSHQLVFLGFALSLALALGVAFYIYARYVKYTPVALRHVPADAEYIVRLNVEQAVVFEPFRRHILSVLETGRAPGETRAKHLERKTTLELTVDTREIVFAELKGGEWLLASAGMFRTDGVVEGVGRLLSDEEIPFEIKGDVLVHPSGVSFGTARDGLLLLASTEKVLRVAQSQSARPRKFDLLEEPGMALSVLAQNPLPLKRKGRNKAYKKLPVPIYGYLQVFSGDPFEVRGQVETPTELPADDKRLLFRADSVNEDLLVPLAHLRADKVVGNVVSASGHLDRAKFESAVKKLGARIHSVLPTSAVPSAPGGSTLSPPVKKASGQE